MDLQPFFYAAFVLNGFGFLNETSALYGLILIPPAQLKGFLTPEGGVFRLLGGWQNLFIEMAKRINVDIIFNANIQQIRRGKKVQIVFNQKHSNHLNTQEFDFLILSPAMNSLFNIVDFNPHELKIFSQLRNLTDLTPLFNVAFVLNGYGFLNETSALYALTFVPPAAVESFMKPERGAYRLFGGWQNLFLEMARQIKVNIIYNANVKQITRGKTVQIVFNQNNGKQLRIKNFDFLILTPAMNSLFNIVDFNPRELAIFSHLRNTYYLKTIVNSISPGRRALSPIENFQYDLNDVEYAVYRSINVHQVSNNITGLDYQLGLKENVDPDGSKYETSIYVQFGKGNPWNPDVDAYIQRLIGKHLQDFNKAKPQVVDQVKWGYYFPNFPPEAITGGALWDILDMQGQYNTWYIGSSVFFESLESVFEYNHLILKLFRKFK